MSSVTCIWKTRIKQWQEVEPVGVCCKQGRAHSTLPTSGRGHMLHALFCVVKVIESSIRLTSAPGGFAAVNISGAVNFSCRGVLCSNCGLDVLLVTNTAA